MRSKKVLLFALSLMPALIGGCGDKENNPPAPTPDLAASSKDIVDTAVAAGQFTTLVGAVQSAGLESTLRSAGPFTVFAPTNAAFQKLPPFLLDKLVTAPYKTELRTYPTTLTDGE